MAIKFNSYPPPRFFLEHATRHPIYDIEIEREQDGDEVRYGITIGHGVHTTADVINAFGGIEKMRTAVMGRIRDEIATAKNEAPDMVPSLLNLLDITARARHSWFLGVTPP